MNIHPAFLAITAAAVLAFSPASAQTVAPPPNDDFANAMMLTGQAVSSTPVAIDGATREGLEPSETDNQTVWYSWTAPRDGIVTMTTAGTTFDPVLSVFNGDSLPTLVLINQDQESGNNTHTTFFAKMGFVYQICVSTNNNNVQGTAVLNIVNKATTITAPVVIGTPAGGNDNFADAQSLGSAPVVSAFTYNIAATREAQEPSYTGNQTVWWVWSAPADTQVTVTTDGSDTTNQISIFNGTSLTSLAPVALGNGYPATATFPAKAGFVYYICVGNVAEFNTEINPVLNIETSASTITSPVVIGSQADANDNFAAAQDLGSNAVVSGFGFNITATTETLEPSQDDDNTLWWTWTAPQDGVLTINAAGTSFDHVLTAYPNNPAAR